MSTKGKAPDSKEGSDESQPSLDLPTDGPFLPDGSWNPIDGRELFFHSYVPDSDDDAEQQALEVVDTEVLDLAEWINAPLSLSFQDRVAEIRRRLDLTSASKPREGAGKLFVEVDRVLLREADGSERVLATETEQVPL